MASARHLDLALDLAPSPTPTVGAIHSATYEFWRNRPLNDLSDLHVFDRCRDFYQDSTSA